jgi:hypothetical protein
LLAAVGVAVTMRHMLADTAVQTAVATEDR